GLAAAPAALDRHQPPLLHVELLLLVDRPLVEAAVAQRAAAGALLVRRLAEANDVAHRDWLNTGCSSVPAAGIVSCTGLTNATIASPASGRSGFSSTALKTTVRFSCSSSTGA